MRWHKGEFEEASMMTTATFMDRLHKRKRRRFGPNAEWQRWFAWHPVEIDLVVVWLEAVERRVETKDGDERIRYRDLQPESEKPDARLGAPG